MHPPYLRERAARMMAAGMPFGEVCRVLGLPRGTVSHWFHGERARRHRENPPEPSRCPRCQPNPGLPGDEETYCYLLGLYLGDGHLVTSAKVPVLRIYCANAWPGLIVEAKRAMLAVLAKNVQLPQQTGCTVVQSYSTHWPCLLPQHGAGRKHERRIRLAEWQQPLVDSHPGYFLRGLIHSDGCRVINKVTRGDKTHFYPRYMFSNESLDIMELCQSSLESLGIGWRMCRRNMLSVARRADVAALDEHVGPEY